MSPYGVQIFQTHKCDPGTTAERFKVRCFHLGRWPRGMVHLRKPLPKGYCWPARHWTELHDHKRIGHVPYRANLLLVDHPSRDLRSNRQSSPLNRNSSRLRSGRRTFWQKRRAPAALGLRQFQYVLTKSFQGDLPLEQIAKGARARTGHLVEFMRLHGHYRARARGTCQAIGPRTHLR